MPIVRSNRTLVGRNGFQNFMETINSMRWERDSFCRGINEPPQDDFGCSPRGIALFHFLDRCGFLTKGCIEIVKRLKHAIEQAEKNPFDPTSGLSIALYKPAKVIHVNIPVA